MLHIALCKVRKENANSTERKRIERRLQWTPPAGLNVKAEYWLETADPKVIIVMDSDDPAAFMEAVVDWDDFFDITVVPALTAEEGLRVAAALAR